MAGPRALASAGAGGGTRRCPWSRGRFCGGSSKAYAEAVVTGKRIRDHPVTAPGRPGKLDPPPAEGLTHFIGTRALLRGLKPPLQSHQAFRMNLIQLVRDHWVHILVPMGFVVGCYLDKRNEEKLTTFRNKSLLFKRELRPNEEVTWK
ncbi:NADH dehydrogenase [ubiquinone] 1 beta subcomplex subunit 1 [Sturnira hondurensis]|uniref:NADH dehydrogenase [ubiquinone] 1 beta subcomplex subunit 1 n=2 Tax=Stenodermatinae TaxID=40234 RepID=UPI001879D381|nr:NADH dehydrogenase [ubiquinone] 1 beta subcomplex subunit 1 [Sturnira hondurensis]